MTVRKHAHAHRSADPSSNGRASAFEDVPAPALPDRMQEIGKPAGAEDVIGLRDALRAAGVREVQLINLTRTQIESVIKLEATTAKLAESIPSLNESIKSLEGTVGRLADLLAANGAGHATICGCKTTPVAGVKVTDRRKAK